MLQGKRLTTRHYVVLLLSILGLLLLYPNLLSNLTQTEGYQPHGYCYVWDHELTTLMVTSDTLIGLSYVSIAITLWMFIRRTRDQMPFHWIFVAFGIFILACGMTHFTDIANIWVSNYWTSGYIRLVTMVASVVTAVALPWVMPNVIRIVRDANLVQQQRDDFLVLSNRLKEEIEQRNRAEQTLLQHKQVLEVSLRAAKAGVWTWDLDSDDVTWDEVIERIHGLNAGEFGGDYNAWKSVVHPDDFEDVENAVQDALNNAVKYDTEYRILMPDRSVRYVSDQAIVIRDDNGDATQMIGVNIDITERKHTEDLLKQVNSELEQRVLQRTADLAMAKHEIESFSYSVSHDLRAPLRAMDGYSQAVLEEYGDLLDEDGKFYLQRIRHATTRMSNLIDDLLTLSRLNRRTLSSSAVNLSEIAQEIIDELRGISPERTVDVDIMTGLLVHGDYHLLRILMENLIKNAWKFTAKQSSAKIEVGMTNDKKKQVLYIKDNGVGFDMTYVDKLFLPFQRLHSQDEFEGTGIGLATVRRVVQRHGGTVWAEGKVDEGTTIYFNLSNGVKNEKE